MDVTSRAVLRGLAAIGTTIAVIATFLPWYLFEVVLPGRGASAVFAVPISLWNVTTLAPVLIAVGALAALACLTLVTDRRAGVVEALVGLGIVVYAIVRAFDVPNLGVNGGGVTAATRVGGGLILAIAGGLMLLIGSLGDLLPGREPEAAAGEAEAGARFERGTPAQGRAAGRART